MTVIRDFILSSPVEASIVGGCLALLLILILFRRRGVIVLAADERGRLLISKRALHRLVEACCEQLKGVATARALVEHHRGEIRTILRLKVRPEAKLDAIQGYLTQEITEIYRENLGLKGEIGPIEIKVVGVVAAEPTF
ncbi:MAG TPA: hypothetical protein VHF69_09895 [Candidatus Synoicihabitans sp.]|nr:hypothetical protein [Candidatus Synoicihabitans sp.]